MTQRMHFFFRFKISVLFDQVFLIFEGFFSYYNGMFLLLYKYIKALEDVVSSDYKTAKKHDWHNEKWSA